MHAGVRWLVYLWLPIGSVYGSAPPEFVFVGEIADQTAPPGLSRPQKGTATVRVEHVLDTGTQSQMAGVEGTAIAMQMREPGNPGIGQRATFYSQIVSFGKVLEVRELKHVIAPPAAASSQEERQATRIKQAELERQSAAATVVLAGKVVAVNPGTAAVASQGSAGRSEHDPEWKEAVVEVSDVLKGHVASKQVTLRFPGSTDVHWYRSPKLQEGQQGVFMLGPDGAALAHVSASNRASEPTVTRPNSVFPIATLPAIREAVQRARD